MIKHKYVSWEYNDETGEYVGTYIEGKHQLPSPKKGNLIQIEINGILKTFEIVSDPEFTNSTGRKILVSFKISETDKKIV